MNFEIQKLYHNLFSLEPLVLKETLTQLLDEKLHLSFGMSITTELLIPFLMEFQLEKSKINFKTIDLLYAMALIRFMNIVVEYYKIKNTSSAGSVPLSYIMKKLHIPNWLVNIRHEATHGNIPSTELLKLGAIFALEWLKKNFWSKLFDKDNNISVSKVIHQEFTEISSIEDFSDKIILNYLNLYPMLRQRNAITKYWKPFLSYITKNQYCTEFILILLTHYLKLKTLGKLKDQKIMERFFTGFMFKKRIRHFKKGRFLKNVKWNAVLVFALTKISENPDCVANPPFIKAFIQNVLDRISTNKKTTSVTKKKIMHILTSYYS